MWVPCITQITEKHPSVAQLGITSLCFSVSSAFAQYSFGLVYLPQTPAEWERSRGCSAVYTYMVCKQVASRVTVRTCWKNNEMPSGARDKCSHVHQCPWFSHWQDGIWTCTVATWSRPLLIIVTTVCRSTTPLELTVRPRCIFQLFIFQQLVVNN